MERVAFLVEETNERLGCLLNPESLVMRRVAGVASRRSSGGQLTGMGLRDDPLLYTGGGKTELELNLLFDVSLAGSSIQTDDVRDLTAPLWNLAENMRTANGSQRPPLVRFVWGKSWNMPGIVAAVAESLERFTANGAPQRSWLRMRLWRVNEPMKEMAAGTGFNSVRLWRVNEPMKEMAAGTGFNSVRLPTQSFSPADLEVAPENVPADRVRVHVMSEGERLDGVAAQYYPNISASDVPMFWRLLASFNNLQDPLHIPAGFLLRIPPLSALGGGTAA
jgi:hypothetical protein